MSLIEIKDNHIKVFGTKYFVGNAPKVTLGAYGDKLAPIGGMNKLEVQDNMPGAKLDGKVRVIDGFTIDTQNSSKANFTAFADASLKPIGGKGGSVGGIYDDLVSKKLKMIQIVVNPEDIKDAVNNSPKVLTRLDEYGNDARVAHEIFVVAYAEFEKSFTSGTNFEVYVDALDMLNIKATGGGVVSGKNVITLERGTCVAYLLVKPKWNKGNTQIDKFDPDEWSLG